MQWWGKVKSRRVEGRGSESAGEEGGDKKRYERLTGGGEMGNRDDDRTETGCRKGKMV